MSLVYQKYNLYTNAAFGKALARKLTYLKDLTILKEHNHCMLQDYEARAKEGAENVFRFKRLPIKEAMVAVYQTQGDLDDGPIVLLLVMTNLWPFT